MDLGKELDKHMKGVYSIFATRGQITLGALIKLLEQRPAEHQVIYDFAMLAPTELDSYRGYYEHLALGHTKEASYELTVGELLKRLKGAIGKEYTGWKGGEYRMDENTPLWVANPGETGGTAVVGLCAATHCTIIKTAYVED